MTDEERKIIEGVFGGPIEVTETGWIMWDCRLENGWHGTIEYDTLHGVYKFKRLGET